MKLVFLFAVLATSVVKEVSAFPQQFCYSYNLVEHQCDDAEVQIIEIPTAPSTCDSEYLLDKIGKKTETEVGRVTTEVGELSATVVNEAQGLDDKIQILTTKLDVLSDNKIKGIEGNIQTLTTNLNVLSDTKVKGLEDKIESLTTNWNTKIKSLEGNIQTLTTKFDGLSETKIKALEKKLDLLLSRMEDSYATTFAVTPNMGSLADVKRMCEDMAGSLLASPFAAGGKLYEKRIITLMATVDINWFYVGLTDEAVEGEFRLPDGRLFNSADTSQIGKWRRGEPNNAGGENYVIMIKHSRLLVDVPAWHRHYGICEIRVHKC